MVENCDFLNRLRNGHLEKSAVTGLFRASRSPTTAKMLAKVHLRLRFPNPGKPRTAGLCGRVAGACDCGPLSCTKIERSSPRRKPSCKVRFFANRHFRKYRPKVTVATLSPTVSHPVFQLRSQTAHVRFHRRKRVHTRLSEKDRTQRLTRRNTGRFGWGWYHYPRSVLHVHKPPRAGCQNGVLCRFWGLVLGAPKERREPSGQRCAYARRCSEASRPRWAA